MELNTENTKYMVKSLDQNTGRVQYVQIDDISFEGLDDFKYLGKIWTNQNSIQEEIKIRWLREWLLSLGAESLSYCFLFKIKFYLSLIFLVEE